MAQVNVHLSTGLPGLDRVLRGLIPGDNIVWQVESVRQYAPFVERYCRAGQQRGQPLVYFRFAQHEPLIEAQPGVEVCRLEPEAGFEAFVSGVHKTIETAGRGAWFVFDCLSDLAEAWYSDTMLGNFFVLTCPYLYDVEAIAYFGLRRRFHAPEVTKLIGSTAQVVLDVYEHRGRVYVHPIKVQQRHSPTMYMLHVWDDSDFRPVTQSATTAQVLSASSCLPGDPERWQSGVWYGTFRAAEEKRQALSRGEPCEAEAYDIFLKLLRTAITRNERMLELLRVYLTLDDVLAVGRRIVGTGLIGGKAVGMLLARAILVGTDSQWRERLETHDSFYVGSDVFYSYLVQNGLWWEWQKHRDPRDFLLDAERARQRILVGTFPAHIQAQFQAMLDYFGQSPIIVRSSSLLEDNFGHSFAGKYQSIFLVNQGSRDQRLHDFLSAVRTIYASTLGEEALLYRARRGMLARDEQMALLVQRVSGAVHGKFFFPHLAGVGFSYNPYAWSKEIDPNSGVLRLVFGLGTRAVERTEDDYPRLVALNAPQRRPVASYEEGLQYVQRRADVLDLQANQLVTLPFEEIVRETADLPLSMIASPEPNASGDRARPPRWVLTFEQVLGATDYVATMRTMLKQLQDAYDCPVDVEFTTNFLEDNSYRINLVQCRPLQVKGEEDTTALPQSVPQENLVLEARGAIVGHSRALGIDRVVYVVPSVYGQLPLRDRYSVARLVGKLARLHGSRDRRHILLIGPGRWGTSMPALGVPVSFSEISNVAVLAEVVVMHDNLVPDVSLGTHFFNELVENDILYFALFPTREGNQLNSQALERFPNRLGELLPEETKWCEAVRVIDPPTGPAGSTLVLYANTIEQRVVCYLQPERP